MPLIIHQDTFEREVSNDHFLAAQLSLPQGAWLVTTKGEIHCMRPGPDLFPAGMALKARDVPSVEARAPLLWTL